ncbi:MAG TPA: ATP-binding cassette domain-containing protein [Syntrophomonadaceae bacterium]|nr:ATP-binding cassette domain-containing protein [Syntrophomonadaceae bacterium]
MKETAIQVRKLNKSYGPLTAVDQLDFTVEAGECFGFLGPNGAGKTTTMKIIYGKAKPDLCKDTLISVFGCHPGKQALMIKALSGIVPQEDNLDSELNVSDNLYIYSKFYGLHPREAKNRIAELLEFMELQDKARVKIKELSGGMQRRLTIARALMNQPRLLILDEPTTGLDPQVRHLIWNKLRELKDMGVTILLTTHYMEEAFQICDRIIIMDKGKKLLEGDPRSLLSDHLEVYVMEIYGLEQERLDSLQSSITPGIRFEIFADALLVYGNDQEELTRLGETLKVDGYHIRQANLEDLFLNVTGRTLNELQ